MQLLQRKKYYAIATLNTLQIASIIFLVVDFNASKNWEFILPAAYIFSSIPTLSIWLIKMAMEVLCLVPLFLLVIGLKGRKIQLGDSWSLIKIFALTMLQVSLLAITFSMHVFIL